MGKYERLRDKLPRFEQAPEWQEKVDLAKRGLRGSTAELAKEFAKAKRAKYRLEDKISTLNVRLEALSQLLVERLEDEEQQKVDLRGGLSISLEDTPYPSVVDRAKLFAWVKQHRMIELLSVHAQTLKGIVSEALVSGRQLPPGVKVFLKTSAKLRGVRRSNGDD